MKFPRRETVGVLAGLVLTAGSAVAQDLALPVPEVSLTTDTRRNILVWDEVPTVAGRSVSNPVFDGFDSLTPSISFVGQYSVDCDYRIRITKEPLAGFDFFSNWG